jgi:hypothetical protein
MRRGFPGRVEAMKFATFDGVAGPHRSGTVRVNPEAVVAVVSAPPLIDGSEISTVYFRGGASFYVVGAPAAVVASLERVYVPDVPVAKPRGACACTFWNATTVSKCVCCGTTTGLPHDHPEQRDDGGGV